MTSIDASIQFSIPSVPYSSVKVTLLGDSQVDSEALAYALGQAAAFARDFGKAFPGHEDAPFTAEDEHPERGRRPILNRGQAPQSRHTGAYCPEHDGVELVLSKDEFQPKDDDGQIIRDKFFCPAKENGTGKNHNVWRSQAVFEEGF